MKKLLFLILFVIAFSFQMYAESLADENKTVTTSEFVTTLSEVPSNVSSWATNEWADIKEYQKASWQAGKEQNAKNLAKIKSFFSNLTNKGDN
jgi:purine-cytosine permease-like protein